MSNHTLLPEKEDGLTSLNDHFFMELASDVRRSMLLKLNEKNTKLSQIASELDMTIQHAHKNATRLVDAGFIEKNSENFLSITPFGKMIMNQFSSYQFLLENKQYFQEHSTTDLPIKFSQRLGVLRKCERVYGIGPVLEKLKTICLTAEEYLKVIVAQYPMDIAKLTTDRAKQGVKISTIFGENTIVPKARSDLLKKASWENLISEGIVQRKMLKRVEVSLVVTEKQACLYFPNLKGETDMMDVFCSQDNLFHEWCLDFFNYQWNRANSFTSSKLTES